MADQGVLQIDRYHENTGDKAYFRGHYYFPGSIGPSLLALPPYLALRTMARWTPLHSMLTARPGRWEFMGFTGPSWPAFVGITVSPYRGLLFLSPVLLLAIPGLVAMGRDPRYRKLALTLAVILAGFLVYNASYLFWWGGRTVGPRFLVPALPFAAVPLAFALHRWLARPVSRWAAYGLIALSVANVWAQTVAGRGYAPETADGVDVTNPLVQYSLPALWHGEVVANYGKALGLEGMWSLLPLVVVVLGLIYAGLTQRPSAQAQL